jgi:hypothetical protein
MKKLKRPDEEIETEMALDGVPTAYLSTLGYEKCILNEEEEEEKAENSYKNLLKYMENNEELLVSGKGNQYKENGYKKSILNEEEIIVTFEEETNENSYENSYENFLNYNDNGAGQMDGGEEKKKIQELARRYNSKAQNYYKVKGANDKIKYRVQVQTGDPIMKEDGKIKQHYLFGGCYDDEADAIIQSRIIFEDYHWNKAFEETNKNDDQSENWLECINRVWQQRMRSQTGPNQERLEPPKFLGFTDIDTEIDDVKAKLEDLDFKIEKLTEKFNKDWKIWVDGIVEGLQ